MRGGNRAQGRLQPKLIRTVLMLVAVMFVALFLVTAHDAYRGHQLREIENQRNQLSKTAERIASLQHSIENLGKLIVYNAVVQTNLEGNVDRPGLYLYAGRKVNSTLKEYQHIIDGVDEITIYTRGGRTLTSRYVRGDFDPAAAQWFGEFMASGRNAGYTGIHRSEPFQDGYAIDVISYITHYYSIRNGREKLGELMIHLDVAQLETIARQDSSVLNGCWLFNGNGEMLVSDGDLRLSLRELREGARDGILERGKSIFVLSEEMSDGWTLITEISVPALMRLSLAAISKLFLLFLVMMLLTAALLSYLIRRIVTPINQLSEAVSAVGRGDLDIHVDIHTDDEIEELADAFNHMVVNIDKLIYESVEHEKKIQQMQMENLMLQINPHFIYNTMNSIVYMARMGGVPQIAEFTNAFISLLQSTLRVRNSVFVSLRDELKTVRSYLYLQKFRYGNKFSAQINCPEELLECQILNVMLQPVVENSIFHGIAPKEGQGHISISAQHSGSELILQVEDDGVGISEEALREITREDYSQSFGVHKIGIGNVRKRIHEIYGANSTLDVESKLGCWTRVTMRIPYCVEPTQGAEHDRDMAKE